MRAQGCLLAALALASPAWAGVKASSELIDTEKVRHGADKAFDGLLTTGWAEGVMGVGEGSWIELRFERPMEVESVSIWPGDLSRGDRSLRENGRPHTVTVSLLVEGEPVTAEARIRDGAEHGEQRVDVPIVGKAAGIRVTLDQAYAGFLRSDTYLAEIAVNFVAGAHPAPAKLDAWRASPAGEKAAAAHKDAVITNFDRIDSAEFGDRDALQELMAWAADGAPYLRERVVREVAAGFRVQALPPDEVAIEALLKLKDANAIPAIQLASLRSTGAEEKRLKATGAYFEAWAELNGGGRRSLPTWGVEGWEKGALRTFGEPAGMLRMADGTLYIADVANHRVSVFDGEEGRALATWGGGEASVTDVWFGGRRRPYVTGREPGKKVGSFTNPVDVALLSTKTAEQIVVLDALGRVQVMDLSGKVQAHWKVEAEMKAAASGAGGAAHLLVSKGQIVVIWGNEGRVYDPVGEETARWTLEDGAPIDATVLKNGKLALAFRDTLVAYGTDGFRHATLLTKEDLPGGYEGWAVEVDEKGRLWTLTDNGWAIKWKKPGVEDFRVRWTEIGTTFPRFDVDQDVLWVVHDGQIERIDAQEVRAAAQAEGE